MTTPHEPAGPPRHTPEAGWARVKAELGDIVPDITDEDERHLDELLAAARGGTDEQMSDGRFPRPRRSRWTARWARRTA